MDKLLKYNGVQEALKFLREDDERTLQDVYKRQGKSVLWTEADGSGISVCDYKNCRIFYSCSGGADQRKCNDLSVSYAGWRFSYGDCRRSEDCLLYTSRCV